MNLYRIKMLHVEKVISEYKFMELRNAWTELLEKIPDIPYTFTWEWVYNWWKYMSSGNDLFLLAARNDERKLVGLAPWMVKKTNIKPLKLNSLVFILDDRGLHMDIICLPDDKDSIIEAILAYVHKSVKEFDILDLYGLNQNSNLLRYFKSNGYKFYNRKISEEICPFIILPEDWGTYYQSLDSKLRKNLKYFRRLLEREHNDGFCFRRINDNSELLSALTALGEMNKYRWNKDSSFNNLQFTNFHRALLVQANNKGWLRFYQLMIDKNAAAILYCFGYKDKFSGYQISFNPDYGRYSPGRLIIEYALKQAVEEGSEIFCWGRGNSDYKFEWTDKYVIESNIILSFSFKGSFAIILLKVKDSIKYYGKKIIPEPVVMKIKKLIKKDK